MKNFRKFLIINGNLSEIMQNKILKLSKIYENFGYEIYCQIFKLAKISEDFKKFYNWILDKIFLNNFVKILEFDFNFL